jgi:hypothetical protein
MKDTELHNNLEKKEVRNVLAKMLVDAGSSNKQPIYIHQKGWDGSIDNAKQHIEYYKKEVEKYETYKAVEILSKQYNWQEYDLSDYIEKTGRLYMSFFGTKSEYLELCKNHNFDVAE